ncbi:IclR family transcriptional regulator [Pusillimonas sp.]|uniref:IclR family transcriptional regulator n=1 Tax=Pusillimonas sp. TaxID=3040095 RepID=UPI0029ABAD89|nr:IclR family transcriptional regulator [Pusillimonas sp.]MDX3895548.1 IclR family transcriptional regulator [Pusillimonas sp.]
MNESSPAPRAPVRSAKSAERASTDIEAVCERTVETVDRQGVKSVEVAGRILEALITKQISVQLKDLSLETRLPAAKLHRYLTSLIRVRLVKQDPHTRMYQLGDFAMELGAAVMHSSGAMIDALHKQRQLCDAVGETVSLAIWSPKGPIVVNVEESNRAVLLTVRVGTLLPVSGTAAGIVFASFLAPHLTQALIARELSEQNRDFQPIVASVGKMKQLMANVRRDTYFVNRGHLLPGVMAIAAPVLDHNGGVVGVFSVLGRENHFGPDREDMAIAHLLRITGGASSRRPWHGSS